MIKIQNNWAKIVSIIIVILFLIYLAFDYKKRITSLQEFNKNIFYMDTYINVKIYSNEKSKALKTLKEVEELYKEYHQLTDRYNEYENVNNIYTINHRIKNEETLTIDSKLYKILKFSKEYYEKTNGLFNINLGNVIDVWKKYRDQETGIPTLDELKNSGSIDINDVVLFEENIILNNKPNIDLGSIAKGYATNEAAKLIYNRGFDKYLINAGGNVIVGKHYADSKYKIGIETPSKTGGVYEIVEIENMSVTTSGSYQRYYEYEGKIYHHLINPNTLFPGEYYKSVSIITEDSSLGDALSTALFLLPVEKGKELLKNYPNTEAIWYTVNDEIIKTDGFINYEQK